MQRVVLGFQYKNADWTLFTSLPPKNPLKWRIEKKKVEKQIN